VKGILPRNPSVKSTTSLPIDGKVFEKKNIRNLKKKFIELFMPRFHQFPISKKFEEATLQ
jgi:hypothetical protein